jgi:amidase/nitrilase
LNLNISILSIVQRWILVGLSIVNPFGEYIAGAVYNEDTIVYADCHANEIRASKVVFEGLDHYSRPDVIQVLLRDEKRRNLLRSSRGQFSY